MSFEFQLSLLLSFLSFFLTLFPLSLSLLFILLFLLSCEIFHGYPRRLSPLISTSIFQFNSSFPFHFLIFTLSFPHIVSFKLVSYLSFIYLLFLFNSSYSNIVTHFFSLYICHSRDFHLIPIQFLIFILFYFS